MHLRDDVLGEVVDLSQEQNQPKDRALRHTRCHRDRVWFLTLNNDPEECLDPMQGRAPYALWVQFQDELWIIEGRDKGS